MIVKLSDAPAAGRMCAGSERALAPTAFASSSHSTTPTPLSNIKADLNFGKGEACRSISNASCTDSLWYVGPYGGAPLQVANCTSANENVAPVPVPCVRSMYKTSGGQLHIVAGLDSTDPDLIPQGLRVT